MASIRPSRVAAGLKPWELRLNDRDYQVGDRTRREFSSPVFHWKTRDGRRFSGRPELVTTQREWRSWRSVGVQTEMDHIAMLNGLAEMIERSIERGADEPAGLDAISGKGG